MMGTSVRPAPLGLRECGALGSIVCDPAAVDDACWRDVFIVALADFAPRPFTTVVAVVAAFRFLG